MGTTKEDCVLALTEHAAVPLGAVLNAIKIVKKGGVEQIDPLIITQASSLSSLPTNSDSMDIVISIGGSPDFPGDKLCEEYSRVLRPGGLILLQLTLHPAPEQMISSIERKLLVSGFLDVQVVQLAPDVPLAMQHVGIIGTKSKWKLGSSFSIKKAKNVLPNVHIDDDYELIDEDSLLSEEDLKKPQILPAVGDCEVGISRKACENCTCGRAEAEEKVEKLGVTMDQLDNPQSACGSCGLGDAFRCGTCPYKGLPPFKLGEKVTLSGNFLAADI